MKRSIWDVRQIDAVKSHSETSCWAYIAYPHTRGMLNLCDQNYYLIFINVKLNMKTGNASKITGVRQLVAEAACTVTESHGL